jgi:hypothetical protein
MKSPTMKNLLRIGLLSVVISSSLALAEDPPPPPPAAEEGGSGMHREGFLLDRSEHTRPMLLDVHVVIPYGYFFYGFGIGAGATFYIPLVKDGFIGPVNDEFGIDFGADFIFHIGYGAFFSVTIPVTAVWTFHITDTFAAYAKAGIALRIWPGSSFPVWPDGVGAVGINWMFSKGMGLRAEVGYPGLKVGLLIAF